MSAAARLPMTSVVSAPPVPTGTPTDLDAWRDWRVVRPGWPLNLVETPRQRLARDAVRALRTATSPLRLTPSFLVIGTQKGGTSSLYGHLCEHPSVGAAEQKEIDYFNWWHERGPRFYRSYFPVRRPGIVTGEATPEYLYHERAPERVVQALPDVKCIVLLRDPVDRAISHYHHQRARGLEPLALEDALAAEPQRLEGERARVLADPTYRSLPLRAFSYVDRGRYAEQLERWFAVLPRDRFLIVPSERFFADPAAVYAEALEFLGLEPFVPKSFRARNTREYTPADAAVRDRLAQQLAEDNERLFELLGERFDWVTPS